MATLSRGQTFGSTETVTNTKLHNLVDLGSVSNIVDADCSPSMNLSDTKLADITTGNKVRGSALGNLASIPSGAGLIPFANIGNLGLSIASIPNLSIEPITRASWVDGVAMRNIQSMPSLAGQLAWYSVVSSLASGGYIGSVGGGTLAGLAAPFWVPTNIQVFTASGTWTKPAGVNKVYVKVWGAGGNGKGSNTYCGGGGGGGYSEGIIAVTGNVTVTVGTGGGGSGGGTSSFAGSTTIQATGGANSTSANGGAGGVGSNGTVNLTGGSGGSSTTTSSGTSSGGGSPMGGAGGSGGGNGIDGTIPGGGGGGGGAFSGGGTGAGGSGANGLVIVYY